MRAEHLVACRREEIVDVEVDAGEIAERVEEEVRILVVAEDKEVDDDDDNHQEFLFPFHLRLLDPLADEEVRDDAEDEDAYVAAARLVVEEEAGRKQERVAEQELFMDEREDGEDDRKESPEVELRKEQRTVRVESKRACEVRYYVVKHMSS